MKVKDIAERIKKVDCVQIHDFTTNFYGKREENEDVIYFKHKDTTYIFSIINDDVEKVFFWGSRVIIDEILSTYNSNHVVECVTRNINEFEWFLGLHYFRFMTLQRCYVTKLKNCENWLLSSISEALKSDAYVLIRLIRTHFDSVTSRYISQDEIEELIEQKLVWKWEKNKEIAAFLIAKREGKKLCIEFLYNGAHDFKASYLIQKAKNYAYQNQLVCVYAWKDVNNMISQKMYDNNEFVWEQIYKVIYMKSAVES